MMSKVAAGEPKKGLTFLRPRPPPTACRSTDWPSAVSSRTEEATERLLGIDVGAWEIFQVSVETGRFAETLVANSGLVKARFPLRRPAGGEQTEWEAP